MNELNIDLTQTPGARLNRKFLGIVFLIIATFHFLNAVFCRPYTSGLNDLSGADLFFIAMNVFAGISLLLKVNIFGQRGKAYIIIESSTIRIRKSRILKEWNLEWDDIDEVEYKIPHIKFRLKNGKVKQLNYIGIGDTELLEFKKVIREFAIEKNIKINRPV